jgi:superfamily II DNA/RNA helicase
VLKWWCRHPPLLCPLILLSAGRLLHHLAEVAGFKLSGVEVVVFDEADRMFEMGFAEQVSQTRPRPRPRLLRRVVVLVLGLGLG